MSRGSSLPECKSYYNKVIYLILCTFMRQNKSGFTFVELIVVLVIIAILSTIGFTVYESYLSTGRDTKRIIQLDWLQKSLTSYASRSKLPLPENSLQISFSGAVFIYQGEITNAIAKTIWFDWDVEDSHLGINPIYSLSSNRKDFQIMSYLEEGLTTQNLTPNSYAAVGYENLYIKTIWKPVWILLDSDSNSPINTIPQYSSLWIYDIISWTWNIDVVLSDSNYFEATSENILQLIPNHSCKRILEMWNSSWDGIYTISPNWSSKIRTFCDMRTDWGGWTLLLNHDVNAWVFPDNAQALSNDIWNPTSWKYSILDQTQYFKKDNMFTFWIHYPELGDSTSWNFWSQQSNPTVNPWTSTGWVTWYTPISIDYSWSWWWGLEYNGTSTLADWNVNSTGWFYAIGNKTLWNWWTPGPTAAVKKVQLYIK